MVYLHKESYLRGTYHKLKFKKIEPYKIDKKIGNNAYLVDVPKDLNISPIFIPNLYDYHGFDGEEHEKPTNRVDQLHKRQKTCLKTSLTCGR